MLQVRGRGATSQLGAFAGGLSYDDLPEEVVAKVRDCIVDAIGGIVFGMTQPWTRMVIDYVQDESGNGRVAIPGTKLRTSASQAVLVAATAGHSFELDDIHVAAHLHAGSIAIPTALAVAEDRGGVSGRSLIAAIAAGYEVGCRVGLAATGSHFKRGHHFQGTCGPFVAASVAANLLGLDEDAAHNAIGIGGSFGAGLMAAQEGAMSKRVHSGRAAQAGVMGAYLAKRGMTGIANVLEAPYGGFLSTLSGAPDYDRLTAGLGEVWEIKKVGFKIYPSAGSVQIAVFLVDQIMRENGLASADIASVQIHCSTMAHRHCAWRYEPVGVTAAQMNLFFTVAAMIEDRELTARQFEDERLNDRRIIDTIDRISIDIDPKFDEGGDVTRQAQRVLVVTKDGRRFEEELMERPGSPSNPMPREFFVSKFTGLAETVLPKGRADKIRRVVDELERREVADLLPLLIP
jgi:2-methylcitrate dehydratase PrpD